MTGFSRIIRATEVPVSGFNVELEADTETRNQIAQRLGIPVVKSFKGDLEVERTADGFDLRGRMTAVLERQCVSSLEFFEEAVEENFEIAFSRYEEEYEHPEGEIEIDDTAPEPLTEEGVDLGEILVQQLSLAMSQHPRKPDAASLALEFGKSNKISPFADLDEKIAHKGDQD